MSVLHLSRVASCRSTAKLVWYVTIAVLSAAPVSAWGDDAHKIVCEIATTLLDAEARAEVKVLVRAIV